MAAPTTTLAWERRIDDGQVSQPPRPERNAWSMHLCKLLSDNYDKFVAAQDIKIIIPDFTKLDRGQRVTKLAELFVRVAEYEASWDPNCVSPDVNGQNDPDHMATGLFQLNVGDQTAFSTRTNFTAAELKDPLNNITSGVAIVLHLIGKHGKITFIKGRDHEVFFESLLFDANELTVDRILRDVWALAV